MLLQSLKRNGIKLLQKIMNRRKRQKSEKKVLEKKEKNIKFRNIYNDY